MDLGDKGKALIQSFETLALTSYQDQGGVWTIAWGHTGVDVGPNQTCTVQQADDWFTEDTAWAVREVTVLVPVPLSQNQFDALVSFVFNVGAGNFKASTMRRMLTASDFAGAADQFPLWCHVDGVVSAGLVRRRAAEQALFTSV